MVVCRGNLILLCFVSVSLYLLANMFFAYSLLMCLICFYPLRLSSRNVNGKLLFSLNKMLNHLVTHSIAYAVEYCIIFIVANFCLS